MQLEALQQNVPLAAPAESSQSWMVPATQASGLLYASNGAVVWVFSYPQGVLFGKLELDGTGGNLCSDNYGNVFMPLYSRAEILEYPHGGSRPIAILSSPTGYYPYACSVDPTTGNLAVTTNQSGPGSPGNVAIYPGAQGTPTVYADADMQSYYYCGYDNRGDLFVDGGGRSAFAELPSGSATFVNIGIKRVKKHPGFGQVQWDGGYITLADPRAREIHRLQISGSKGVIFGTTHFEGGVDREGWQSWIQSGTVIVPAGALGSEVGFWNYPAGGKRTRTIHGFGKPGIVGVTVSVSTSASYAGSAQSHARTHARE